MKNFITLAVSLFSLSIFGQVGINNATPNATLHVNAKTTDGSRPEGLIAPRLTGDQIKAGDAQYGTAQKGAIIYATSATASPTAKTINITSEGYYFFDGVTWQKISGAAAADTTNDAWINDAANSMVKLGTNANGTARATGADFVARDNGSVGIGTGNPDVSAALDITSSNKGFLPPRVALTSTTDVTTIPGPAVGLVVYNTATAGSSPQNVVPGLFYFNGTEWLRFIANSASSSQFIPTVIGNARTQTNVQLTPTSTLFWTPSFTEINGSSINSSGNFTAPENGFYQISLSWEYYGGAGTNISGDIGTANATGISSSTNGITSGTLLLRGSGTVWQSCDTVGLRYLTAGTSLGDVSLYRGGGFSFSTANRFRNINIVVTKLGN